ncbi:ATP-binding protein [Candidatus Gottesmanbacteria bacterium]|nr:ATP-binding protein [Candidatus Gottesmanbacteria bacterium]
MKTYTDPVLNSLLQAFFSNPKDLGFKKMFGLELYKRGESQDALVLLREVFAQDKDLNVEKAIVELEAKVGPDKSQEEAQIKTPTQGLTFIDVAGMDDVKDAIRTDIIYPYQHPELYKQYSNKAGGGILLYGPPGCGKTFIAKATAGEIEAKFYSIHIHEILSSYAGEGEKMLHEMFEIARDNKPSVLFLDEIDAVGMSREKTRGVLRTLVNQFLTELDGIESNNDGVLIIGATNLPWEVDTALRRPGRFDKIIFVPPPDKQARIKLFELSLATKPHDDIDYESLVHMTKKFSAADITRICDEAAERSFKEAVKVGKTIPITQKLLVDVAQNSKSTITEWFSTVNNYIKYSNDSGFYNTVKDYLDTLDHD